jgi:adenylate cyclase
MAARLEGLAHPGGIACSAVVRNQVGNKLELEFIDQGEKSVKNIAQPVHVYFVNLEICKWRPRPPGAERGRARQTVGGYPAFQQSNDPSRILQRRHHRDIITGLSNVSRACSFSPQHCLHLQGQGRRLEEIAKLAWRLVETASEAGTGYGSTPS